MPSTSSFQTTYCPTGYYKITLPSYVFLIFRHLWLINQLSSFVHVYFFCIFLSTIIYHHDLLSVWFTKSSLLYVWQNLLTVLRWKVSFYDIEDLQLLYWGGLYKYRFKLLFSSRCYCLGDNLQSSYSIQSYIHNVLNIIPHIQILR